MRVLQELAREIENFFKKRKSKKTLTEIARFYEENFASEESEETVIGVRPTIHKDVLSHVEDIGEKARNLNIPPSSIAGYCYVRLMDEGLYMVMESDSNLIDEDGIKKGMVMDKLETGNTQKLEDTIEVIFKKYGVAQQKVEASRRIAEKYDLGDTYISVAERSEKRIERREKYFSVILEAVEDGKEEEAIQALEGFREFVDGQKEDLLKEMKAIKADTERWMAE